MSLEVYLIRHGESDLNLRRTFDDDPDAPLTELGLEQAREVGRKLKEMLSGRENEIVAVYCSPYERARMTCEESLIQADLEIFEPIEDERIRERSFAGKNSKIKGKTVEFLWEDGKKQENAITLQEYEGIWTKGSPLSEEFEIETLEDMEFRGGCFFDDLAKEYEEGIILIYTHGGFIRIAEALFNGCPDGGRLYEIPFVENGAIVKYILD